MLLIEGYNRFIFRPSWKLLEILLVFVIVGVDFVIEFDVV